MPRSWKSIFEKRRFDVTYRTIVREVWRWNLSPKWVLGGFSLKQLESLLAPPSSSWQLTALQKRTRLLGVWSPAYIQKWHRVLPKSGATLRISTSWSRGQVACVAPYPSLLCTCTNICQWSHYYVPSHSPEPAPSVKTSERTVRVQM